MFKCSLLFFNLGHHVPQPLNLFSLTRFKFNVLKKVIGYQKMDSLRYLGECVCDGFVEELQKRARGGFSIACVNSGKSVDGCNLLHRVDLVAGTSA